MHQSLLFPFKNTDIGYIFKLDLCDYIAGKFKNSPRPIRCPINQWAILLVLNAIAQQSDDGSAGMKIKVPRLMIPGNYKTTVQLKSGSGEVMTCATTMLQVK